MLPIVFVILTIILMWGVNSQQFNCPPEQAFCFWIREATTNWTTAYADCIGSGGSLISSEHSPYIEEWMSSFGTPISERKVWTRLHRINHRFQWLDPKPEFKQIAVSEWIPGHPLLHQTKKWDCVVANHRMLFESVNCDDSFAIICAINTNRKPELNNLALPSQDILQVNLTIDPKEFKVHEKTNHLEIDRNNSNSLMLKCNVVYNGTRKLEYSWLKDGVFLEDVKPDLIPSMVNDKSKPISEGGKYAIFQKQGTYQCQVREFGSVQRTTSNSIILTYRRILNGIVSLWPTDANTFTSNREIMEQVANFVHQKILKEHFKFINIETSWDPLYSLFGLDGLEFRNSFYIDVPREYTHSIMNHILDVIGEKVSSFLKDSLVVRKIRLTWATYCPGRNETINQSSSSDTIQMYWPSAWSSSNIIHPNNINMLCLQDNNGAEPLTGLCLPDFAQGASFTSLEQKNCKQLIAKSEVRCLPGYRWMETMQICFKITDTASWNATMAVCVSEWPANDIDEIDYDTHLTLLNRLQEEEKLSELWLPIRRQSTYGPILYYSTSVNYGPVGASFKRMESWTGLLDEECFLKNKEGSIQLSDCSKRSIPAVCAYRPKNTGTLGLTNLCPHSWYGFRIHGGRLVCYSLIKNVLPMTWYEAERKCRRENFDISANVSMATFEDQEKAQQWDIVRSNVYSSETTSAWIGLRWTESNHKFCWYNSINNCSFTYLNWHSPINWNDGQFGVMNEFGSWDLLPNSSLRHEVLCQAEIDLTVSQDIIVRPYPNDIINVDIIQQVHQIDPKVQWFNDLTEFFSNGWRPMAPFPNVQVAADVKCYLDGELFRIFRTFPATFSLSPSFTKAGTFSCEGWIGWPRRFIRTEPIVVLRPPSSLIYVLLLDVESTELQTKHNETIDFYPEPLEDITKRLSSLTSYGADVKVTGHRWWVLGERLRMLVRTVLTSRPGHQQESWRDLMEKVFFLPRTGTKKFSYHIVDIRSGDVCEQDSTDLLGGGTINWNTIPIGFTSETSGRCFTQKGQPLLRKCLGNPNSGAFWEPLTDQSVSITNATCAQETDLYRTLKMLTDQVIADTIFPNSALEKLAGLTELTQQMGGFELGQAVRLLRASTERIQQPSEQQFYYTSHTLTAILASPGQLELAQSLPGISNDLVESLEYVMGNVAIPDGTLGVAFHHPKMATECLLDIEKVVGYGANVDKNNLEILEGARILQYEDSLVKDVAQRDIAIILPVDEIRQREGIDDRINLRLSFSVFPNADLFDARPVTSFLTNGIPTTFVVDSAVIVAQVGSSSISNLNQSVRIFFRSRSQHSRSVVPVCVFWDKSSMSTGWSPYGCQYVGRSQDLYICECNHLTPLALLFPYFDGDNRIDFGHYQALSFISLIGCVFSMLGLSLVLLTFLLFRKWRKSLGNKILFNFSLALFCLNTCFLCAGYVTFDSVLCKATAAAMHYFLVASFAWMVVEGIYQYLNYVIIIGAKNYKSCFMRKAAPLAWGLSMLPVLGVLIYDLQLYNLSNDFCWMKLEAFYVVVLAPVSIILLFNLLIFVSVLKSVVCIQLRRGIRTSQPVKTRTWYQFRMAICMFFLLGLAWIFGFVSVGDARLVFTYLFCIFNSLQGFVIFIFFVLKEKKARKLWFEFTRITVVHDKFITTNKTPFLSRSYPTSHNSHEQENVF